MVVQGFKHDVTGGSTAHDRGMDVVQLAAGTLRGWRGGARGEGQGGGGRAGDRRASRLHRCIGHRSLLFFHCHSDLTNFAFGLLHMCMLALLLSLRIVLWRLLIAVASVDWIVGRNAPTASAAAAAAARRGKREEQPRAEAEAESGVRAPPQARARTSEKLPVDTGAEAVAVAALAASSACSRMGCACAF